jgi:hypothetical protein
MSQDLGHSFWPRSTQNMRCLVLISVPSRTLQQIILRPNSRNIVVADPLGHDDRSDQFLYCYPSIPRLICEQLKILISYRDHQLRHNIRMPPLNLAILVRGDKLWSVEIGVEIAILTSGTQLLVCSRRVVNAQLGFSTSWANLVGKIFREASLSKSLQLAELKQAFLPMDGHTDLACLMFTDVMWEVGHYLVRDSNSVRRRIAYHTVSSLC